MRSSLIVLASALFILFGLAGCQSSGAGNTVCGDCGQLKGSDTCCVEEVVCEGCGLQKGSPGCCTVVAGTDAP